MYTADKIERENMQQMSEEDSRAINGLVESALAEMLGVAAERRFAKPFVISITDGHGDTTTFTMWQDGRVEGNADFLLVFPLTVALVDGGGKRIEAEIGQPSMGGAENE